MAERSRALPGFSDHVIGALASFARWLGVSIIHALGNPQEERRLQPPLVGVQPYVDRPYRLAR